MPEFEYTEWNKRLTEALFHRDEYNSESFLRRRNPRAPAAPPDGAVRCDRRVIHGLGQAWGKSGAEELLFLTSFDPEGLDLGRLFARVDIPMGEARYRVIRCGRIIACAAALGGDSISLGAGFIGTLGAEVQDASYNKYLLSCSHVIAGTPTGGMNSGSRTVSEIWQPGAPATAKSGTRWGVLHDYVDLHDDGITPNLMDAALGEPDHLGNLAPGLLTLGTITGVNTNPLAAPRLPVSKMGATTGKTDGVLGTWNMAFLMDFPDGSTGLFEQQYGIFGTGSGYFALPGDSGAVVVDGSRQAVALLIGTVTGIDLTFATPIERVLNHFSVTFAGASSGPVPPSPAMPWPAASTPLPVNININIHVHLNP